MRTTIDLPEDLHRRVKTLARDTSRSMSDAAVELIRRGLERDRLDIRTSARTGLPVVSIGRAIDAEDVARLDDDA
jgi:predicted transcriptional regulator